MSQNFIALRIVLAGTSMYFRDCAYSDVVTLTYVSTLAGQSQFLELCTADFGRNPTRN